MAYGAMIALRDRGLRVPEDISIVGIDDSLEGTVPHNMLTTVRFNLHERGRIIFNLSVGIEGDAGAYTSIRLPGRAHRTWLGGVLPMMSYRCMKIGESHDQS